MSRTWADLAADLALYYAAALLAGATLWAVSAWVDRRHEKRQRPQRQRRRLANQTIDSQDVADAPLGILPLPEDNEPPLTPPRQTSFADAVQDLKRQKGRHQ